ncbi:hypothetical protein [Halosimplex pelagicum]|uniref:Uncharacterized protein n=1 Tax=Halosimplex pelagicum TaxID=869886 RepID=A0A7D5TH56_9EURY|nr:hypothetical protein [Halosimplex pelagicum]QLH82440.1 hypothetical protein HZS54_12805 [Halosimplex pelagicum]QLH82496.1 hypothetical protein HZS54_13110 [Halosimplex pelagicum]
MPDTMTMHDYSGTEVEVEKLDDAGAGGARLDVEHPDGRRWRLEVSRSGEPEVVTSWRDGELCDVDVPEWLEDNLKRAAGPA